MSDDLVRGINAKLDTIEGAINERLDKMAGQIKDAGSADEALKGEISALKETFNTTKNELFQAIQEPAHTQETTPDIKSMGKQLIETSEYKDFMAGKGHGTGDIEVYNVATKSDNNTGAEQRVAGAYNAVSNILTVEDVLPRRATSNTAVEFAQETETDNVAFRAQATAPSETSLAFAVVRNGVETVSGWSQITREMASDSSDLAAWIDTRMGYMVNNKVEAGIIGGNGTAPQLSGFGKAANAPDHGIAKESGGALLKQHVVIRKAVAKLYTKGYRANVAFVHPTDAEALEIEQGRVDVKGINLGVNLVQSAAVTAGEFIILDTTACALYNREGVTVRLSYDDGTNARSGLITVVAERRVAFCVFAPNGVLKGKLAGN